ncbi:NlpC/P60 family protein [Hoeflea sp. YIM 152468]|uniref:NlpC/P60 family protein n=1 Tax=Hoeflea sp. YIM 152468 TaxID=3031759 RepID=UPI0023DA384A|nr:NlpC/P60 family protein [Hoeflea sp. YIM 152468]MDF1607272.1 NlpC/P60 family protein [Hoeflea sp. YIM 152468]
MSGADAGQAIVDAARAWIGTPYRHQGGQKGAGCDCLGLVRGVYREVTGRQAEEPGPYAPDWAERSGTDRLILAARRHCGNSIPIQDARAGDIILFRWRDGMMAKHAGILSGPDHFIHAYEPAGVIESVLVTSWRRRIAAVHRFP